jgi:adenylate cyclase class 2
MVRFDFAQVLARLAEWKSTPTPSEVESDHYYNAPDRDFRKTDEAFRLRRVGSGSRITYKGPKHPGPTKTRTEIEVPLRDGDDPAADFLRLIEHLGYRATAVVRKTRQEYPLARDGFDLQVCLDEVDQVGRYVEVEIVASPERRDDAQRVLQTVAAELGLRDSERRSYLQLFLEKLGSDK